MEDQNSIIIIGGGFAGLAAGIYGQMNGYDTKIIEMNDTPGGLCTSWTIKGFTIDGCIHWLAGSSPESGINDIWKEVGVAQGLQIVNMDEYMSFEDAQGRRLVFYTDIDKMEKSLLEFSPQDSEAISDFIEGARMCLAFDSPSGNKKFLVRLGNVFKMALTYLLKGRKMKRWMNTSALDFANRIKDPLLKESFIKMWFPDFSMFFILFTLAYMHDKNAGYPIGGSLPMSEAMAERYVSLGGSLMYNSRVEKILTENNRAVGVRLTDGTEFRAKRVISAADGYTTLFKMLDRQFGDENTYMPYEKWKIFPPLLYIGIGVDRTFPEVPESISGTFFELKEPVIIGGLEKRWLSYHIFNHDHTLAPEGKTVMVVMMESDYDYWKELSAYPDRYRSAKDEAGKKVIELLETKFPGISDSVEMIDVATPVTFERYTGNWKGSFEGWLITPGNSNVLLKRMPQTLPGLKNFYMCGQWVEPGGGLPTAVMSGRRLFEFICKEDRREFSAIT
jgi:phytoene dehydrogenase-like protein